MTDSSPLRHSPPPPPPPARESGSIGNHSNAKPSHPSWNSLVSDITMSEEDEDGHLLSQKSKRNGSGHIQRNHRYPQQQQQNQHRSYPSRHQHHHNNHDQSPFRSEPGSSAASLLMEYSQSSEEGFSSKSKREHSREENNNVNSSMEDNLLAPTGNSSSFRFRGDLTQSSRIVRFGPSPAPDSELSMSGDNTNARQQIAAEEGVVLAANLAGKNIGGKSKSRHRRGKNHHHRHHREHHRGGGGGTTVNRETFLSTSNRWMTQLAYSFSTPPAVKNRKSFAANEDSKQPVPSEDTPEKAPVNDNKPSKDKVTFAPVINANGNTAAHQTVQKSSHANDNKNENTPLLPLYDDDEDTTTFPGQHHLHRHSVQHGHQKLYPSTHLQRHSFDQISVAVAFLKDYEAGRPPTLPSNVSKISPWQMGLCRLKFSTGYSVALGSAMMSLFLSSALEGASSTESNVRLQMLSALNMYALVVFGTDMWVRNQFQSINYYKRRPQQQRLAATESRRISPSRPALPIMVETRKSQANLLTRPLFLFGLFLCFENLGWLWAKPDRDFVVLYSSIAKPIVMYYISRQARHAMEALVRIARTVIRVLVIELVLILSFAAVACRLFHDFESFDHLSVAWLSLFKLATTVVNPSIWMPMYKQTHWAAAYFVLFIVVTVFYMHSLVLSVVFQTYIQAATEIHDRSVADREDGLQLAFLALKNQHHLDSRKQQHSQGSASEEGKIALQAAQSGGIPMYLVREALESLRPHYNVMKVNALIDFFDKNNGDDVDYPTFRSKIKQALNASIRTTRIASPLALSIELTAVIVAMVNFVYVILLTSSFNAGWFVAIELQLGALITIVGVAELLLRTNPLRVQNFTPMTRFNGTFDGLAILAALTSCFGIVLAILGEPSALEYILMGRAVDMIRVMRFFQIFRDVVRRSSDVVPALLGPIALVLTMLHIFVYIGMAFWGGAIEVGVLDQITPLYDLNNFNSYLEGMVTMFQVLVVNDWHAIAEVFMYANRCSSPIIVYPFFILGNLFGVSILLNVITAFFVESFVSKLGGTESRVEQPKLNPSKEFSIRASENSGVKRNSSIHSIAHLADDETDSDDHDADSEGSSDSSELFEFDVYEREGYDKIVSTVVGAQDQDDFARQVCNQLEMFESLTPGREKVGYLVCCQQTMNRYGNRRFETEAAEFLGKMALHGLVSDIHSELLVLLDSSKKSFQDRSLVRVYSHPDDPSKKLEISATIIRRHPALSLFVTRIIA